MTPAKQTKTAEEGGDIYGIYTPHPELNVYQRVSIAKRIVAKYTFSKVMPDKGANGEQKLKYPYLPIDQVKPVVEDAMNKAGLVLLRGELAGIEDVREPWDAKNDWGGVTHWMHISATQEFTWVNIDNPEDRYTQLFAGEAKDNSDKTLSKLYTSIYKNFIKAEFNISDSPKDDIDNTEDEVKEEAAQRKAAANARPDPFFNKGKTAPAKGVSETALDRPPEVKAESIVKMAKDPTARLRMNAIVKDLGLDASIYAVDALMARPDVIDALYGAGVRAIKAREGDQ